MRAVVSWAWTIALGLAVGVTGVLRAESPAVTVPAGSAELRLPESLENYTRIDWPRHFTTPQAKTMDATPEDNPTTDAGATLGRVLFYDTRLSNSGTVACASCHQQEQAFSDSRRFSVGHGGIAGDRNSMSLVNLRFQHTGLFWDERVATLEEQVLVPFQSPVEMGMTQARVLAAIGQDPRYVPLFQQAFGDPEITNQRIARAIAQFIRSLVSYQSKYDVGLAAVDSPEQDFANFTPAENRGKTLFRENCRICHQNSRAQQGETFEMFAALNNGVNVDATERDGGQGDLSFNPTEVGLFKASSLRNIEKTAPYMHDGRFATLDDVIEHYASGIHRHPLVSGFAFRMRFTSEDKAALIAFLKTLTDDKFLTDPKFANPWVQQPTPLEETVVAAVSIAPATGTESLSPAERNRRVLALEGLRLGETLPWLQGLDTNQNGELEATEWQPLVKVLAQTGLPPRADTRRFDRRTRRVGGAGRVRTGFMLHDRNEDQRVTADEAPPEQRYIVAAADWNADGGVDADEARFWTAFQRLFEVDDNGRDVGRAARFLANELAVADHELPEALKVFNAGRAEYRAEQLRLNTGLAAQLATTLGPSGYDAFRDRLLNRLVERPAVTDVAAQERGLTEHVQSFDQDENGRLSGFELSLLAEHLDETPGGFSRKPGAPPTIDIHASRLMAFGHDGVSIVVADVPDRLHWFVTTGDTNHDERLTKAEAEALLRQIGFERLLKSGVYIGGGFGNVFSQADGLVTQLGVPVATVETVKQHLDQHQTDLKQLSETIVAREYIHLRDRQTRQQRAGVSPTTPTPRQP